MPFWSRKERTRATTPAALGRRDKFDELDNTNIGPSDMGSSAGYKNLVRKRWPGTRASSIVSSLTLYSHAISGLDLECFEVSVDGELLKRELPGWMKNPMPTNPAISLRVFNQQVMRSLVLDGNAFIFVMRHPVTNRILSLTVLDPLTVRVDGDIYDPRYFVDKVDTNQSFFNGDKNMATISFDTREIYKQAKEHPYYGYHTSETILHIASDFNPGALRGVSPIMTAEGSRDLEIYATEYAIDWFQKRGVPDYLFSISMQGYTDDEQQRAIAHYENVHFGQGGKGLPAVMIGDVKAHALPVDPRNSQMVEGRQLAGTENRGNMRVPPFMGGDNRPGAVSYKSSTAQRAEFYASSVQPLLALIEDGYTHLLNSSKLRFKFNLDDILRGDTQTRYEQHALGIKAGFVTRKEAREAEGFPYLGQEGEDELDINAQNMDDDDIMRERTNPEIKTEVDDNGAF